MDPGTIKATRNSGVPTSLFRDLSLAYIQSLSAPPAIESG
jgi:hypothetical protein